MSFDRFFHHFAHECIENTIILSSESMSTISSGIGKMMELTHLSMEGNDLEASQTVELNVFREQMRYFEVLSEHKTLEVQFDYKTEYIIYRLALQILTWVN